MTPLLAAQRQLEAIADQLAVEFIPDGCRQGMRAWYLARLAEIQGLILDAVEAKQDAPRELLDDRDLEREYRLKRKTWQAMRAAGTGPAYIKTGHSKRARCLYRREDVEAWLVARRIEPRASC